jgi:hypothetical protein
MKKQIIVSMTLAAALAAGQAFAQQQNTEPRILSCVESHRIADIPRTEKAYAQCLQSEVDGVVESALAHVTRLKLCVPEKEFPFIEKALERLMKEGRTPTIRFRAYLASMVHDMPSLFVQEQAVDFATPEDLYAALSERVHRNLLGNNL